MALTLVQIAAQAYGEIGLTAPTQVVGSTILADGAQILALLNREGNELASMEGGWPQLRGEQIITLVPGQQTYSFPTDIAFFGSETARRLVSEGGAADLVAAKNVLAHVPDINDFVAGVAIMLKPDGVFTVEFPHLLNLIREVQFDTMYHEHYTYLSLLALEKIFARHGLAIFDVEKQSTHGGSLRVFAAPTAVAATLAAGSTPSTGMPRSMKYCSM